MRNRVALVMTTGATAVGLALAAPVARADISLRSPIRWQQLPSL